jgi:hypothetical protein
MNADIRLSVKFWDHPKTIKLSKRLGLEGIRSLQVLWLWAAQEHPDGNLFGMEIEDIEIAADWNNEEGAFVQALVDLRWFDVVEGGYALHDWKDHNPWAASAERRSDEGRFNRIKSTCPNIAQALHILGYESISRTEYDDLWNRRAHLNEELRLVLEEYKKGPSEDLKNRIRLIIKGGLSTSKLPLEGTLEGTLEGWSKVPLEDALRYPPTPAPAPAPAPAPKEKDKDKKQNPPLPPEGGPDVADSESEAPGSVLEAPPLKSFQVSKDKRRKKKDMTPEELDAHMQSIRPMEGAPYDQLACHVMLECIPYVPCYAPYPGADTRLVQELGQEYPHVNLAAEFRRARDWLKTAALEAPSKIPKSDFHRFLRNWVSNAVKKYGVGQPRVIGFETETIFVPAKDEPGGECNAGSSAPKT